MNRGEKYFLVIVAIILVSSISIIIYWYLGNSQKDFVEQVTLDPAVIGTPIEPGILIVQEMLNQGNDVIPIDTVLSEKDNYVCAIQTSYGPMALKVKKGMIREDVIWGAGTTTAYLIEDRVYRYSADYSKWLKFPYAPDAELATKQKTHGILSEYELINLTTPETAICVKAEIADEDFVFPMKEALDVEEFISNLNI
ncbi:MAG: hypothetical protein KKE20_07500 [Nanoarchaeota archaeon]|nr:hypothetical protein [Nanoarchaeota archaeon]